MLAGGGLAGGGRRSGEGGDAWRAQLASLPTDAPPDYDRSLDGSGGHLPGREGARAEQMRGARDALEPTRLGQMSQSRAAQASQFEAARVAERVDAERRRRAAARPGARAVNAAARAVSQPDAIAAAQARVAATNNPNHKRHQKDARAREKAAQHAEEADDSCDYGDSGEEVAVDQDEGALGGGGDLSDYVDDDGPAQARQAAVGQVDPGEEVQAIALIKGRRKWTLENTCVLTGRTGSVPAAASLTSAAREGWQTVVQLVEDRPSGSRILYAYLLRHGWSSPNDMQDLGSGQRVHQCCAASPCPRCQPAGRGAAGRGVAQAPVSEI